MTWTYTGPSSSTSDEVRFLMGDTVEGADVTLSNEEITYLLAESGGAVYAAAIEGCLSLAGLYARKAQSKSVGDMSITYAGRAKEMRDHAASLRARQARNTVTAPWTHADALLRAEDRTDPTGNGTEFQTGQFDNPGS